MVGIWAEGVLIGQMAVMGTLTLEDAVTKNVTRATTFLPSCRPNELIVVMKRMAVHPEWRGNECRCIFWKPRWTCLSSAPPIMCSRKCRSIMCAAGNCSCAMVSAWSRRRSTQRPETRFLCKAGARLCLPPTPACSISIQLPFRRHHAPDGGEALIGQIDEGEAIKLAFYAAPTWRRHGR